ncbi:MAG: SMF family protein [Cenarchaeum symbiont of Oopsacas minuta]|nr:SMF family protein [Cenarchaeum symbiont of Oopsacas minuta]
MVYKINYASIQIDDLLGHALNDVEEKFAPKMIFYKGTMRIPVSYPRVSIIGSRKASERGLLEAEEISKILIENKIIIVSGLAKGIDTVGHKTAIKYDGKTIAVIGTPLNKVYPKENSELQKEIMKNHLVISQYPVGHSTTPKDFVLRNKTMALISDATVIVEAEESSGSLYQGWEMLRIGRPLFICKDVVNDEKLKWPEKMLQYGAIKLDNSRHILEYLPTSVTIPELFQ